MSVVGIFGQPYGLKLLTAACPTFQSVVREGSAAAALRHIHFPRADDSHWPPWAIISDEDYPLRRERKGTGYWADSGSLVLSFDLFVPLDRDRDVESSEAWFLEKVGAIVSEMEALAGQGEPLTGQTHLAVEAFTRRDGPWEVDAAEFGQLPNLDAREAPQRLWHVSFDVEF